MRESLGSVPNTSGVAIHVHNPSTWQVEAGGSEMYSHPWLNSEFEASLASHETLLREGRGTKKYKHLKIERPPLQSHYGMLKCPNP